MSELPTTRRAPPSTKARGRLYLLVIGADRFSAIALPKSGILSVGREPKSDIHLEDDLVSRRHARVAVEGGAVSITDLHSENGTLVLGEKLAPEETVGLSVGQLVEIGRSRLAILRRETPLRSLRLWSQKHAADRLAEVCRQIADHGGSAALVHIKIDGACEDELVMGALAQVVGDGDLAARCGANVFELVLANAHADRCARAKAALEVGLSAAGIAARLGAAVCPDDGSDPESISRAARRRAAPGQTSIEPVVTDPRMRAVYALAERVAAGTISVLISGESGTGKELVAEAIAAASPRRRAPLLRLNCGAMTDSLFESELFGYEKGAFTGASEAKPGLLELADGGTVFLDEVGELSPASQVSLLRVLESKVFRRVGGTEEIAVDVRFVAATNRDLEAEVARGTFRHDLYFRIAGVTVEVPPLRERPKDIASLARAFAEAAGQRLGRGAIEFTDAALEALHQHSWPGNVRELRNAIDRAALLADGAIGAEHLPQPSRVQPAEDLDHLSADELRERADIIALLAEHGGNQTLTAKALGMSRPTLSKRLDRYRIARPKKRPK